jgi:hypothetical protein
MSAWELGTRRRVARVLSPGALAVRGVAVRGVAVRGVAVRGVAVLVACCGLACCSLAGGVSPARAAAPPTVSDQAAFASGVGQFSATLNGTVDPEGVPTSYHFLYGPTPAYGLAAPSPDRYVPVNETDDAVSVVVGELQPGSTYHFALVANSPEGQSVGPDETFQTPPVPAPVVVTGGASGVSVGAVTLAGSIDPQGFEAGYYFQYGPSTAYGSRWPSLNVTLGALSGPQSVLSFLEGLQPGTLYHYRLLATNPGGTTYGADQTFQTPEYPASTIQEAPVLKTPLGINPETKPSTKEPKHKAKKRKKTKRKASKHRKKR